MTRSVRARCFWCDRPMVRRRQPKSRWISCAVTRDHIIPQSHPDFPGDRNNVVLACARCNEARGRTPAVLFLLFAVERLKPAPQGSVRDVVMAYRAWVRERRPMQRGIAA